MNRKPDAGTLTFVGKDPEDHHDAYTSQRQPADTPVLQELPSKYMELGIVAYLHVTC